ncbi:four helix bundle protein [bacterium]|nr:four helix bundle protein [bacterium]
MAAPANELQVITFAKDLSSYVMQATLKSPKAFRFTYVSKLQDTALAALENLYMANNVFIGQNIQRPGAANITKRLEHQRIAMAKLKLLAYLAMAAFEQKVITAKQFEQISLKSVNCQNLLGGWMNGDRKRFKCE